MTVAEVKHDNLPKPTSEHSTHIRRAGQGGAESAVRTQAPGSLLWFHWEYWHPTPPEGSALLIYNDTMAVGESKKGKIQLVKHQNKLCLHSLPLLLSGGEPGSCHPKTLQQMCHITCLLNPIHTDWSFTEEQSSASSFIFTFYGNEVTTWHLGLQSATPDGRYF